MGEPVVVNGVELPALRLAQSPGNGDSFNQGQQDFLGAALAEEFKGGRRPEIARFIGALSYHAGLAGWNSHRPAFTARQDTSVIDGALRTAGHYVREWAKTT